MVREKLLNYCDALNDDLIELGCIGQKRMMDAYSISRLWQAVREAAAYDTIDASLGYVDTATLVLQTQFGKNVLQFLERAPNQSVRYNDNKTGSTACEAAEPGFIVSTYHHTYAGNAPILLEDETGISSVMKFNKDGERTLLALQDDERFVAGGLYGVPPHIVRSLTEAKPSEGLVIIGADEFYGKVHNPLPIRLTNFVIDEPVRKDFSVALGKGEDGLANIAMMKEFFERNADSDYTAAKKRGKQVLHTLRHARFDVY